MSVRSVPGGEGWVLRKDGKLFNGRYRGNNWSDDFSKAFEFRDIDPWYREKIAGEHGAEIVEYRTAKHELEELKLREQLVALKSVHEKLKVETPTDRPTDRVEVPCMPTKTVPVHRSRSWSVPGTAMVWHHDEGAETAYLAGLMPTATKAHVLAIIQALQEIASDMP